jgi:hypothetical protein
MLHLFYLEHCPYCVSALAAVREMRWTEVRTVLVSDAEKQAYKERHRMDTFPQFVWVDDDRRKKKRLLGGSEVVPLLRALGDLHDEGRDHVSRKGLAKLVAIALSP